ncbi:hypothetical protein [Ralstonia pseudosolanacearum]|uniref:hypothetical protein n=1 Tax=Ralstonia pseudosolanacearum TaxID=1310165 RepID=UPI001E47F1FC|nr:hypothetical protein [Ralstonia pseudosolanacearum]
MLFFPVVAILLLPSAALMPDQGREVLENGVTGLQWAYLAFVVAPLAFTAILHSVQMLRRSGLVASAPEEMQRLNQGRFFFYSLLATCVGIGTLVAPLFRFKLEAECAETTGMECHPGWPILVVVGYFTGLLLVPFLLNCRPMSSSETRGIWKLMRKRHAPVVIQLALVTIAGAILAKDHSRFEDYAPILAGGVAAFLVARLPNRTVNSQGTKKPSYWQRVWMCVADARPTLILALLVLFAFAAFPVDAGERLESLLVLYAATLAWLVLTSFIWTCFLQLPHRLPVAGLLLFVATLATAANMMYGSSDSVRAVIPPVGSIGEKVLDGRKNAPLKSIAQDFTIWSSSNKETAGQRPVVIVLAEGGGIRAAQWANNMLYQFGIGDGEILRNTYAVVGVSGGAMGTTGYLASLAALNEYHLNHKVENYVWGQPTAVAHNTAHTAFSRDLMAPWLARFLSLEGLRVIFPYDLALSPSELLREVWGSYLTCGREPVPAGLLREFKEVCDRLPSIINAPIRAFPKTVGDRPLPRLIYTATHIESGTRVIAASVDFSERDFPRAIDANRILGGRMSLLDAAYSSARFPGISRPGALIDENGQARAHVVDGGYLDGSGALTAGDIAVAITKATAGKVVPIVLDLNSNPDDDNTSADQPNPTAPSPTRPVTEMFGLFKGVKQANGVRDVAAVESLRHQVCALGGGLLTIQVPRKAAPLALGWTLSQRATTRLTRAELNVVKSIAPDTEIQHRPLSLKDVYERAIRECS